MVSLKIWICLKTNSPSWWARTCMRGNSSTCPRSNLNPASSENTDPSLTLKMHLSSRQRYPGHLIKHYFMRFSLVPEKWPILLPVKVPIDYNLQPLVGMSCCIPNLFVGDNPSICLKKKTWYNHHQHHCCHHQHRHLPHPNSLAADFIWKNLITDNNCNLTCMSFTSWLYLDSFNSECKLKAQQTPESVITWY